MLLYQQGFRYFNMGYAVGDGGAAADRLARGDVRDPAPLGPLVHYAGPVSWMAAAVSRSARGRASPPADRGAPPQAADAAIAEHSILIALAIAFLAPFVFILLTALMTNDQALSPASGRSRSHLGNFSDVFDAAPLLRYAANSFLYAGLATLGVLISSVPVAYALARLRWRGRNAALRPRPGDDDAAAAGDDRPALRDVLQAAPDRHALAG